MRSERQLMREREYLERWRRRGGVIWSVVLYRTWPSTLALVLISLLLLFLPPARELLWGIQESINIHWSELLKAVREQGSDYSKVWESWQTFLVNGVLPYVAFWLGSLLIACSLALAARTSGVLNIHSDVSAEQRGVLRIYARILF